MRLFDVGLTKGIDIMRKLGFNIPTSPSIEHVLSAIVSVDEMAAEYDLECVNDLRDSNVNESTLEIMQIYDSTYSSGMVLNSPFCKFSRGYSHLLFWCFSRLTSFTSANHHFGNHKVRT